MVRPRSTSARPPICACRSRAEPHRRAVVVAPAPVTDGIDPLDLDSLDLDPIDLDPVDLDPLDLEPVAGIEPVDTVDDPCRSRSVHMRCRRRWCSPRWRASPTLRSARLCRWFAPGLVYVNEMVMATPVVHGNAKTDRMISFAADEHPRSLQLYGSDPQIMGEAVHKLCDAGRVDHIDINFGCPAAKVTRRGGGAAVPARPELFRAIVRAAVSNADPYGSAGHREVPHGTVRRLAHAPSYRRGMRRGRRGSNRTARTNGAAALLRAGPLGGDRRAEGRRSARFRCSATATSGKRTTRSG